MARMSDYPLNDITPANLTYDSFCEAAARSRLYSDYTDRFYSQAEHAYIVSLYAERAAREDEYPEDVVLTIARSALLWPAFDFVFDYFEVPRRRYAWQRALNTSSRLMRDEVEALGITKSFPNRGCVYPLRATIAFLPWERAAAAFSQRFAELWPDWEEAARAEVWRAGVRALGAS